MPTPRRGESEKSFVRRCVPQVIREGRKPNQANAQCHSMFRQHKKKERGEEFDFVPAADGYLLEVFESFAACMEYEAQNGRPRTDVQTLIFAKATFPTKGSAQSWAKNHDFKTTPIRETTNSWRIQQRAVAEFRPGSFRVLEFRRGVKSVIGRPKQQGG